MPLKARLNQQKIFSFNFNENSWEALKKQPVQMICCEKRAVLKKSKLGTLFFAHHTKGECESEGETAEHLYIKNLIAIIALRNGWNVITEKHGETPHGEKWIADVYLTKGNAKLVFEVQWSYQGQEEFIRRQSKYQESGVRAAWLYRLKSNKKFWSSNFPSRYDIPSFAMKMKSNGVESLYVPQFDVPIDEFIEGMLVGELNWIPRKDQKFSVGVIPHVENCWKCKRKTNVVLGLEVSDPHSNFSFFQMFSDKGVPELLVQPDVLNALSNHNVGIVKERYSKTREESYLSNGCFYCDALMGNFFLHGALMNYWGELPAPIYNFDLVHGSHGLRITEGWLFKGQKPLDSF